MTQAYEKRNLEGFEGDTIMRDKFKQLIDDYEIGVVIELGTYLGGTTKQLASMVGHVVTVEINSEFYKRAKDFLKTTNPLKTKSDSIKIDNVTMYGEDSVTVLPSILEALSGSNLLIFADSHWLDNNPLLAELEIIAQAGIKPVIAIHDFKVPEHPELGFDTYKDIVYEWSWIEESIERIYGKDGYKKEYNSQATGAKRGIIYIMPV